ncbi:unnamed protein product [Peniophora sp. CBMAI 1063]|nr:unnamed protein product [Peniophora sp. CBMAI 1063]
MEYYAHPATLCRAAEEIHIPEDWTPHHYLLPPYQASADSFVTISSLLSPPPAHMRSYGMPEYLWYWFLDWRAAPQDVRDFLVYRTGLGFRLRWPRKPVVGPPTPAQAAWLARQPPKPPRTDLERIHDLFVLWDGELKQHFASLYEPTDTPPVFYRFQSDLAPAALYQMSTSASPSPSTPTRDYASFPLATPVPSPARP